MSDGCLVDSNVTSSVSFQTISLNGFKDKRIFDAIRFLFCSEFSSLVARPSFRDFYNSGCVLLFVAKKWEALHLGVLMVAEVEH